MSAISDIKTGIYNLLFAVEGIGNVYKQYREIRKPKNFDTVFVSDEIINTWMITNPNIINDPEALGGIIRRHWTFQIEGWYSFNDSGSSETSFDTLVEAIQDKFEGEHNIGGVSYENECLQVESKAVEEFNGVSCHHAILTIIVDKLPV